MDECAICGHEESPLEEIPGTYITTDHLDPDERSSFYVCGACVNWVLEALIARGETRVSIKFKETSP